MYIYKAIKEGNLEEVKRFVQHEVMKNPLIRKKSDGIPFLCACLYGSLDIIKYLLVCGANFDDRNVMGKSALMDASLFERFAVAKLLLECGANPNLKSPDNSTALNYAFSSKSWRIILLFHKHFCRLEELDRKQLHEQRYRCHLKQHETF